MPAAEAIDLRRALEKDEIVPFFQPLVELRTGLLRGFEVLARWQHPLRGMILPDDFIPLAEENNLNGFVTENLLRTVFAAAKEIPEHLTLSVNISLTQLTDSTLPRHIRSAAERARFPLNRLILEITETSLAVNPEKAYFIANQLKSQGSRLSLDDFGTGYSSLRHLQALPFDELKIDASFIRAMTHTRESRKIAAAIIGLGNSLDLVTVAEGIEDQTHADMLLWLGCDIGQGWLYGRPVPAAELGHFLDTRIVPGAAPSSQIVDESDLRFEALPAQRLAQLHAIYDGSPVGICFLDRHLRYISINKRLAEINNIPISHHLGRTVAEVVPLSASKMEPWLRRALQGEAITDLEMREPDAARPGQFNTRLVSFQPARDEADEVIGISVSVIDITRRKQVEEALAESEDHYRHTVELNPQIPWTADPGGMILDASHRWEDFTGISKQGALGTGWLRAVHPEDIQPVLSLWQEAMRNCSTLDVQYRLRRRDGVWRWMRSRAAPRRNEFGDIIRWYGTLEDIHDYKKTLEDLQRSEARLQAVFNAVPVGIVIAEAPTGNIIMSNPRAENILGRSVSTLQTMDDLRHTEAFRPDGSRLPSHEYPLARAIQNGETIDAEEILYQRGNGTPVWISAGAAPVRDSNGNITGGVVAIQDIDREKREMQRLQDLLKTQPPPPSTP